MSGIISIVIFFPILPSTQWCFLANFSLSSNSCRIFLIYYLNMVDVIPPTSKYPTRYIWRRKINVYSFSNDRKEFQRFSVWILLECRFRIFWQMHLHLSTSMHIDLKKFSIMWWRQPNLSSHLFQLSCGDVWFDFFNSDGLAVEKYWDSYWFFIFDLVNSFFFFIIRNFQEETYFGGITRKFLIFKSFFFKTSYFTAWLRSSRYQGFSCIHTFSLNDS